MDLSKMSVAESRALDAKVAGLIEKGRKKEREAALERIYAVAHSLGMPLAAIMQSDSTKLAKTRPTGPKYRDPKNSANTWGGSGPRPAWIKAALAAGVALEGLRA
jgi:DNA-binding protein H-NS